MTKFKYMLPILATLFAVIAVFAFQKKETKQEPVTNVIAVIPAKPTPLQWFFNGSPGQESNPAKYQLEPLNDVTCGGDGTLCSIWDIPGMDEDEPNLSYGAVNPLNPNYESYDPDYRVEN